MNLRPSYWIAAFLLHTAILGLLMASSLFQKVPEKPPVITAVLVTLPPVKPQPKPEPPKPEPPKPEPPKPKPPEPKPEPPKPEPSKPKPLSPSFKADVVKRLKCENIPEMRREAQALQGEERGYLLAEIASMQAQCAQKELDKKKEEERQRREEAKRVQEEEKRQKEEEKRRLEDMQRMLDQERVDRELAEQARRKAEFDAQIAAEQNARDTAERNRELAIWVGQLQAKVKRNWTRPPGLPDSLKTLVTVSQLPTGEVVNVRLAKSSGNSSFDDSVVKAVYKASPLPKVSNPAIFQKEFNFCFSAIDGAVCR